MTNTIFDLVEEDIPEGKEGFFAIASKAPEPKDDSFFNSVTDYAKTFLKGTAEGLGRLGRIMGPTLDLQESRGTQEQLEQQTEALNELLPTDEGYVQSSIRRGLQQAPTALAFPGSGAATIPRAAAAGFLGEGAKELGAPEWAQTIAELTAYIGPDITKKLLEKGNDKALIVAAKKLGLSDEAIAPLIQSDIKQKWLTKLVPKRGSTQSILSKSKEEIDKARGVLGESELAKYVVSKEVAQDLNKNINNILKEIPHSVRTKIKTDFNDLKSGNLTGSKLMNFWADVNHEMGPNSKQLSLLKKPMRETLNIISPELAKDFDTVNALYSKYYPIAKRLEPNVMSDIVQASKSLGLLAAIFAGPHPGLMALGIPYSVSKISQKMLTNPRFQQISHKMIDAATQNKYMLFKKSAELLINEASKVSPNIEKELENITDEDLMALYSSVNQPSSPPSNGQTKK